MAKKEEIKEPEKDEMQQLNDILNSVFKDTDGNNSGNSDVKDLETIKILLASILHEKHLESLTNIDESEIDDINDAFYLYEYYDNPLILNFIEHRLKLCRSVTGNNRKNLLNILTDIAGKSGFNTELNNVNSGILGKLRGR